MDRIRKQLDFLIEIDKIKSIFRQTYITGEIRHENDAEHSWHLALMALILSEHFEEDIDVLKVLKLVLIHDIIEVYAGDTYSYDEKANVGKFERELESANKIYGILPREQGDEYKDLWLEFEERRTPEAVFANTLDKIQPVILNYLTEGKAWIEHGIYSDQVINRNKDLLKFTPKLEKLFYEIISSAEEKGYLKRRDN